MVHKIYAREVEEARRAEERRRIQARYEFLVERQSDEAERFKRLEAEATNWERATRLRTCAEAVEPRSLREGGLADELRNWLDWACAKADWLDPLIQICDAILDASEPKRYGYSWW